MTHPSFFCSSIILHVPFLSSLLFDPPCPILPACYPPSSIAFLSSFMCSFIAHHVPSLFILLFHHPPNPTQLAFLCSFITHPSHSSFPCSITHHIASLFLYTSIFNVPPLLPLLLCCPPIPSHLPVLSPAGSHPSFLCSCISHHVLFLHVLYCHPLLPIPPCSPPPPSHPIPLFTLLPECAVIHSVSSLPAMPYSSITHHVPSCPLVLLHPTCPVPPYGSPPSPTTPHPFFLHSSITHHLPSLLLVLLHCPSYPTFLSSCHTCIPSLSPAPPSSISYSLLSSSTSHHLLMSSLLSPLLHLHPIASIFILLCLQFFFPFHIPPYVNISPSLLILHQLPPPLSPPLHLTIFLSLLILH